MGRYTLKMLLAIYTSTCGIASLATDHSELDKSKKVGTDSKPDVRIINCPAELTLGALCLAPERRKHFSILNQVAKACGRVSVTVPPKKVLTFLPNQHTILHPETMNEISAKGIDSVKISFMSMDEKEDRVCNLALKYVSHFTDAYRLDVSSSDSNDAGMMTIKSMPKLRIIWAASSAIRGGCLKSLVKFPALEELDISECQPFNQTELVHLSELKNFKVLSIKNCGINKTGLLAISKCQNLEELDLSGNKKIDDSCAPLFLSLKNLRTLSLMKTAMTVEGVQKLAPLKLRRLDLKETSINPSELAKIQSLFPGTHIVSRETKNMSEDKKMLMDPILGH